ncbi:MAG: RnfABCDGE type electron transport complex subunit D [Lachnospiraceae bacterium]|nr:RnfABCDGE type electron transport complex subunit D [Lachnospiraceae bacterium]
MSNLYHVSTSPHGEAQDTTQKIMRDVIIALIPATVWGIWLFGAHAALVVLLCVVASVATEYIWNYCMKKPQTVSDLSAAVTGLLIALNMPASIPLWMPVLGCVFAIVVVKQLYGGLGQNFMNPALAARCFLLISFAGSMTSFPSVDGVSTATPLAVIKSGDGAISLSDMFFGYTSGTIGEVSALLLLVGGIYLLARKVITWDIPVVYIATVAVFMFLFGGTLGYSFDLTFVLKEVCGGGLMLGAFFMATDYVTSPITPKGRILYAFILGCLTGVFRVCGNSAEGVSYAIILGNILVPLIERVTLPKAFGREGK